MTGFVATHYTDVYGIRILGKSEAAVIEAVHAYERSIPARIPRHSFLINEFAQPIIIANPEERVAA